MQDLAAKGSYQRLAGVALFGNAPMEQMRDTRLLSPVPCVSATISAFRLVMNAGRSRSTALRARQALDYGRRPGTRIATFWSLFY